MGRCNEIAGAGLPETGVYSDVPTISDAHNDFLKMAETGTNSPKINLGKLVNISIKRSSLKQTSSSQMGLCEDLKFHTKLFGNKDLEPVEEVESLEELKADLEGLGYDLSELANKWRR